MINYFKLILLAVMLNFRKVTNIYNLVKILRVEIKTSSYPILILGVMSF